ncbi:MAG: hypothetical protein ABUL66_01910 [Verrucomicrobiota bacterium]
MNQSLLAVTLGLSLASFCNAGDVFMSGSTAMRGVVYSALTNAGTVFTTAPSTTLFNGGGGSANYMAFQGTLVGGSGTTTIYCHWSGSEAGILDVCSNTVVTETFIDSTLLDGTDHGSALPGTLQNKPVDLAMGDNDQTYSRTRKPTLTKKAEVGIITFEWVRNPGLWTGTNVTDSQIRQAFRGFSPRTVFSGNAADVNDFVYVSGRNNQSGTRVNALGTSGYGIFTPVNQVEMDASGVMQLLPSGDYAGDDGFDSGGTLAGTLGADTTTQPDLWNDTTGYSVISYLGISDATTAISHGAVPLSLNGVPFSPEAVIEGKYNFWGNEFIFAANNVAAGSEADKAFTNLAATTGINAFCDGIKAIKLTDMHSTRTGPTADPAHN